ncbi:MAG TPA: 3-hydroxyacyl-CoA dehydrogenase family protein [Nitrososphaeraceae archaeon]|nr:3-hydroxyacyl-CoA dehydrogenase family protein [Nitrososphaeraceae archaeon]
MSSINRITVLGSGIMGHGIAQVSAMAGYNVTLRDIDQSFLDKAMEKIQWSLNKLVEKQKITTNQAEDILGRILPVVDLREALRGADMLIEAVPEDMNLKRKVYKEINQCSETKTIYASNTSTLPITELGELTNRPEHFIGLHFFNPPQLMQLVEVIPGKLTNQDITDKAMDYVLRIGKQPILCRKDVAGFIVNRVFIPLVHEAAYCQDRDKASILQIDSAVKFKMAFPMGIFELADYTGLDVIHKATIEMYSRDNAVINPHPKIKQLFDEGNLGQKSGRGFYDYKGEKYERIDLTAQEAENYDPINLIAVAANSAAWLLSNGVCNEEDLEKAMKLGMGLKEKLFETIESFGIKRIVNRLRELEKEYGFFYEPNRYLINYKRS